MFVPTFALLLAGTAGSPLSLGADTGAAILQDPPIAIRLDRNGEYDPGHDAQVSVDTEVDGFLLVIHADPEGRLRVLFPLEPYDDAFVEGGGEYELVNRGGRGAFYVTDVAGYGTVFAALSEWPFHVAEYSKDHRWDYDRLRLAPDRDIEDALVDLVAGMAYDGWFDYDMVEYEVYGAESYARNVSYVDAGYACCSSSVGISIHVGDPYWPYYGPPYYYASYYWPWYPYYYSRPYYGYRPYYVYRPRYWYPRSGRYYRTGTRYAGPRDYRFKPPYRYDPRGRRSDPYRDRGIGVQGRLAGAGGDIDYRGRRGTSPDRRARPGSSGTRPRLTTTSGRRPSPVTPTTRRGSGGAVGGGATPQRRAGGRRSSPTTSAAPGRGSPSSSARRPVDRRSDGPGFERVKTRRPTLNPGTDRIDRRASPAPGRRTTVSNGGSRAQGRPVLRRQQPRAGGTESRQRPTLDRSRSTTRSSSPARSTTRRTVTRPSRQTGGAARSSGNSRPSRAAPARPQQRTVSRPQQRTASRAPQRSASRPSVQRRPAARSPSRSAAKSGSRRRPR